MGTCFTSTRHVNGRQPKSERPSRQSHLDNAYKDKLPNVHGKSYNAQSSYNRWVCGNQKTCGNKNDRERHFDINIGKSFRIASICISRVNYKFVST